MPKKKSPKKKIAKKKSPKVSKEKKITLGNSKNWEAEEDARTLINAEMLKRDPVKYAKATKAAKRLLVKEKAEFKAMQKIAREK